MNENPSEYAVVRARDLRLGDQIVAIRKDGEQSWRPYSHTVDEGDNLHPIGAAAQYGYKVAIKPHDRRYSPYAMPEAALSKQAAYAAMHDDIKAGKVRVTVNTSNYGPLGVDINDVNIAGQRVRVAVDPTLRPGEVRILQPKIDGVGVELLQEMYLDRQRDVPLKGLYKTWHPTPAQREYLRAWWSARVKASTATAPSPRPSYRQSPPRGVTVLVDTDEP